MKRIALCVLAVCLVGCTVQEPQNQPASNEQRTVTVTLTEPPNVEPTAIPVTAEPLSFQAELGVPYRGGLKLYLIELEDEWLLAEQWRDGMSVYSREKTVTEAEQTELMELLSPALKEEWVCLELPYAETGYFALTVTFSDGTTKNYGAETEALPMELLAFLEQVETVTEQFDE